MTLLSLSLPLPLSLSPSTSAMANPPPDYDTQHEAVQPMEAPIQQPAIFATPGGIRIRQEHTGILRSLGSLPCVGCLFSSIRCCACHDGIEFVPDTSMSTNWCLAYNRRALFNDDRVLGPEAITANGVKVQLSGHAQSAIRLKRDAMAGKVFKVTFTKFNSVECFCLCCVGCCLCCEPLVLEDTIAIDKIWYGHIPQTPCLDCPPLTRALLCCLPLFGCCEERVNINIKDVAYVGAPEQQYMG